MKKQLTIVEGALPFKMVEKWWGDEFFTTFYNFQEDDWRYMHTVVSFEETGDSRYGYLGSDNDQHPVVQRSIESLENYINRYDNKDTEIQDMITNGGSGIITLYHMQVKAQKWYKKILSRKEVKNSKHASGLASNPNHRGQGFGRRINVKTLNQLQKDGVKTIAFETTSFFSYYSAMSAVAELDLKFNEPPVEDEMEYSGAMPVKKRLADKAKSIGILEKDIIHAFRYFIVWLN